MIDEFKKFILKGSVIDLSTGVIIGAAFTGIVSSFSKGIVEPILALAGKGPNPQLKIPIMNKMIEVTEKGADGTDVTKMVNKMIELDLGIIVGALISFLITAAVVFFVIVKPMNKLVAMANKPKDEPAAPAEPSEDVKLLTEIRDLLKAK
jgi:large conductance mechanosensitive channel